MKTIAINNKASVDCKKITDLTFYAKTTSSFANSKEKKYISKAKMNQNLFSNRIPSRTQIFQKKLKNPNIPKIPNVPKIWKKRLTKG